MSETLIIVPIARTATPDFVSGCAPRLYARVPVDDTFVLAECLRLSRAGNVEEAEDLLECWCDLGRMH